MAAKSKKKDTRARAWTFIIYPDSAPADWETILTTKYHLKWASSPLHDADLNADNTEKKPHYHIVVYFTNVKSFEQVKEISQFLNATIPQKVHNMQGLLEYFIHKNHPDKAQYSEKDIKSVGIDIEKELNDENELRLNILREIINFCDANDILEFWEIYKYSSTDNKKWFEALSYNCAYVVNSYLKSRRNSKK